MHLNGSTRSRSHRHDRLAAGRPAAVALGLTVALAACATQPAATPAQPASGATPAASGGLAAPAGPVSATPAPLTRVLAAPPALSLNQLALFVAADHGLFQQQGLDLEWTIMRSSSAVAATASGEVDYLYSGDSGVFASAQGMPLKLFLCNAKNQIHRLVVAPVLRDWPDLRGKVLGTTDIMSTTSLVADSMLERHGLRKGDVSYLPTGNTENSLTSLVAGQLDAAILSAPAYVMAELQGFRIMAKSEDYIPLPPNCAVAHDNKLRDKADEVKRVIRGTLAAMDLIQNDKSRAVQTMMTVLNMEPGLAERLYDDVRLQFVTNGKMTDAQIAWQLDEARERLGSDVSPTKVYDWSLLEQVNAEPARR